MQGFSHFDDSGNAVMIDVTEKKSTTRMAVAEGTIFCNKAIIDAILQKNIKKGDVLGVARIAGIMAVKQTAHLIPMCHPLLISKSSIDFEINEEKNCIKALCTVKIEALTGVNIALLTIYDMCKAVDKRMLISDIHLVEKHGGKSADFYFDGAK